MWANGKATAEGAQRAGTLWAHLAIPQKCLPAKAGGDTQMKIVLMRVKKHNTPWDGDIFRGCPGKPEKTRTVSWTNWWALDPRKEPTASRDPHSLPVFVKATFISDLLLLPASVPAVCIPCAAACILGAAVCILYVAVCILCVAACSCVQLCTFCVQLYASRVQLYASHVQLCASLSSLVGPCSLQ